MSHEHSMVEVHRRYCSVCGEADAAPDCSGQGGVISKERDELLDDLLAYKGLEPEGVRALDEAADGILEALSAERAYAGWLLEGWPRGLTQYPRPPQYSEKELAFLVALATMRGTTPATEVR